MYITQLEALIGTYERATIKKVSGLKGKWTQEPLI